MKRYFTYHSKPVQQCLLDYPVTTNPQTASRWPPMEVRDRNGRYDMCLESVSQGTWPFLLLYNTFFGFNTRLILWEIIPLSGNKIFSQSWYFWQKNSLEFLFTTIWWWDNAWLSLFLILSKNVRKQDVRKQDFFLKYKFLKIMSNLHRTMSELS